jgi:putative SPBc2 prophage-derived single-strand DNA-specific exonuclease yorK
MYKLNNKSVNDYKNLDTIIEQLFIQNGIDNPQEYIRLSNSKDGEHKEKLKNIDKAVLMLSKHIENKSKIHILVDSDVDGYTSASILYQYLKDLLIENKVPLENLTYSLHRTKEHGISFDIDIPNDINLLIIPDASSNDYQQHKEYKDKGVDIIVLDHHSAKQVSENALIVNNQLCDYPNKQLSGVGVVYKFLQELDEYYWRNNAEQYLDLVALGMIADSMDIREVETKYYINQGLNNITNKLFQALVDKQQYSTKGIINPQSISFYIAPLINAMIRLGSQIEKEMMFRAFCQIDEVFPYQKRGTDIYVDEDIYTRVARLCTNIKAKQKKAVDKQVGLLYTLAKQQTNNKIIILCNNDIDKSLTGLTAIQLSNRFRKPVLLFRYSEKYKQYKGSGRSLDNISVDNLQKFLLNSGYINTQGHPYAFGIVDVNVNKLNELQEYCNNNIDIDNDTIVNFKIPFEELNPLFILKAREFQDYVGKGIKECKILVRDVITDETNVQLIGTGNTIKIEFDGFEMIEFNTNEERYNELIKGQHISVVGRCSLNDYNGIFTPQIIIDEIYFYRLHRIKNITFEVEQDV